MSRILLFLILLAAGFAAGYGAARWKAVELLSAKMSPAQTESSVPFQPTQYPLENFPFCIAIIGKNNGAYLEKTLQSAVSQNYENFRIVYVDDGSDDGSADLARELIYASPRFAQIQFVQNKQPLGALLSLAHLAKSCANDEIIVVLNGEDWLAHEWVLARLNQYYADPDLWLTYGQSLDYPTFQMGHARPFHEEGKPIRAQPFGATHLKTFYAGLFKKIREADFQYKGEFFSAAADLAYMFPMLEMAKTHSQCLAEVLYICNRESFTAEDREARAFFEKYVRSLQPYPAIASLDFKSTSEGAE